MIVKLFEVRDRGTCIPVMAVRFPGNSWLSTQERWLLQRAGYGDHPASYVQIVEIEGGRGRSLCDPFDVDDGVSRTRFVAYRHIIAEWDDLDSGDVIDVRYLLGESTEPAASDRLAEEALL